MAFSELADTEDDEGGGLQLDAAHLAHTADLIAARCHPGVRVRDADEVLQALVVALGHLAPAHAPGADGAAVAGHAIPLACVAAAAADALAAEGDADVLEEAVALARTCRVRTELQDPGLQWSRVLLDAAAVCVEALVSVALWEELPHEPLAEHEHLPTPREAAREALLLLVAVCLEAMVVLGPAPAEGLRPR